MNKVFRVVGIILFFTCIITINFITKNADIENYKTIYYINATLTIILGIVFLSFFIPTPISKLREPRTQLFFVVFGLVTFTVWSVAAGCYLLGATRNLKTLEGKCYVEVTRRLGRSSDHIYNVVFTEVEANAPNIKIGNFEIIYGPGDNTVRLNKDHSHFFDERFPVEGKYPCKNDFRVTAVDAPLGLGTVVESEAL